MHTTIKLLLIGALCQVFTAEATLLVSGEIKASDNQNFYSPKTDTWRVEVKWMKPEGEVVAPNDVVVVFDSGNIASQIEQTKVTLFTAQEELQRIKNNNGQSALEGEYAVKRNELLLEKARIDASVPKKQLSAYDYEKYQLELEKAAIELNKAKQNLEKIITNNDVALKKAAAIN